MADQTAQQQKPVIQIVHAIAGRVRLKASTPDNQPALNNLAEELSQRQGIEEIRQNPKTGSVTVIFNTNVLSLPVLLNELQLSGALLTNNNFSSTNQNSLPPATSTNFWQTQTLSIVPLLVGLLVTRGLGLVGWRAVLSYIIASSSTRQILDWVQSDIPTENPTPKPPPFAPAPPLSCTVAHALPGRVRFKVPLLAENPQYSPLIEKYLATVAGVSSVRTNTVSASVTVTYQTGTLPDTQMRSCLAEIIEDVVGLQLLDEPAPPPTLFEETVPLVSELHSQVEPATSEELKPIVPATEILPDTAEFEQSEIETEIDIDEDISPSEYQGPVQAEVIQETVSQQQVADIVDTGPPQVAVQTVATEAEIAVLERSYLEPSALSDTPQNDAELVAPATITSLAVTPPEPLATSVETKDLDNELPDEVEMSLFDHLEELRQRIFYSLIAFFVAAMGCFFAVKPIVQLLEVPAHNIKFIQIAPGEYFFVSLKTAGYSGLLLATPFVLYQIIQFVLPGLTRRERRFLGPIVLGSSVLFVAGLAFAYVALIPAALNFLISYGAGVVEELLSIERYFEFVLLLMLSTGLAFQIPVIQMLLGLLGIVSSRQMISGWRYVFLGAAILGAVLTPSTDPLTQCLLAGAVIGLYFGGVGAVAVLGR